MKRKNIILFMPETLRADAVNGNPEARAKTPNMDALAESGVRFNNVCVQHSVCSPSRCSMFTGLYPHTMGRRTLTSLVQAGDHNMFRDLKEAGYKTVCFGKNDLLSPEATPLSFDRWQSAYEPTDNGKYKIQYPEGHRLAKSFYNGCAPADEDGELKDQDWAWVRSALDFIAEDHTQPFCLFLPLSFVHPPYRVHEPFFSMHDRSKIPAPIEADLTDKRRYANLIHEKYGLDGLTVGELKEIKAVYFGMVSRVDHQLGQLVEKLKKTGQYENTVIIVFSDHGDYTGDFGLTEKWFSGLEEPLVHTPLIIHNPEMPPCPDRDCFVEMVDLYPTVLELAGIEPVHYNFGKSIVGLLNPKTPDKHRSYIFAEGGHNPDESHLDELQKDSYHGIYYEKVMLYHYDPLTISKAWMVRDERYKYIYCPDEFDELYDLKEDPNETKNIADLDEHKQTIAEMKNRLLKWLSYTADRVPDKQNPRGWMDR